MELGAGEFKIAMHIARKVCTKCSTYGTDVGIQISPSKLTLSVVKLSKSRSKLVVSAKQSNPHGVSARRVQNGNEYCQISMYQSVLHTMALRIRSRNSNIAVETHIVDR